MPVEPSASEVMEQRERSCDPELLDTPTYLKDWREREERRKKALAPPPSPFRIPEATLNGLIVLCLIGLAIFVLTIMGSCPKTPPSPSPVSHHASRPQEVRR